MRMTMKNIEKIKTGWPIPETVKESFVEFCAHVGAIAQEDCAGALLLWQHLPSQLREMAKLDAKGSPVIDPDFWEGLKDGLEVSIQALIESQKQTKQKNPSKSG